MNARTTIRAERLTLRKAANGLLRVMAKKYPDAKARLRYPHIPKAEYSTGHYIDIDYIYHGDSFLISILVDTFARRLTPTIWVGACYETTAELRAVTRRLNRQLWRPRALTSRDWTWVGREFSMRSALPDRDLGRPLIEAYDEGQKFIGMYFDWDPTRPLLGLRPIIRRSAQFLAEMADALVQLSTKHRSLAKDDDFPVEARKVRVSTITVPRNHRQAELRKKRDGYRCRICGLFPNDRYGVEGHACLQVHHIEAIHTGRKRWYTLADLITVCANCHAVLGRLEPDHRGLVELRRRFRSDAA